MGNVHKQGVVQATPTVVYQYIADVAHMPHYISAFTAVLSGPEPAGPPTVGQRYQVRANFLGSNLVLGLRLAQLQPDHLIELALEGNPNGTLTTRLAPAHGGQATTVSVTLDTPAFNSIMLNMVMGGALEESMTRLNQALQGR